VVETSGLRHTRPTPDPRSTNFSKIHREPSLKSESVIHRATPNASEAKCVQAGVILLAGSAGWLRFSEAAHRGKAVFNQRGICWLIPRSPAPFNLKTGMEVSGHGCPAEWLLG
jgi:hypothetical protein